ncbi:MAG TPA: tyrosine-type recombinase/integrase [Streptosporangiaceae bacterium]
MHVHMLRHSAASFLAAAGVPVSDIVAQLGHADGGALALEVYVHPLAEELAPCRRAPGSGRGWAAVSWPSISPWSALSRGLAGVPG